MRIGIPEAQALQLLLDNSGADIVAETRRIARQPGLRPITTPVCSPKPACRSTMKAHSLRRLAGSAAASWELSGSTCDSHLKPLPRNLSVLAVDNAMIARLPGTDRAHLLSGAEKVPLASAQELWRPGEPVAHVYFPIRGFVCLIATDPPPSGLEIAMIGREGMLGMQAVLGSDRAPFRAVVHAEGSAWRMAMDVFQQHLSCHPATKQLLDRYVTFRLSQLATLAHCLCHHEVGPRLARWLLMSQDRAGSDRLRVTQEALGSMLGVRRVSVTIAATALQHRGVIAYHRGNLQVLDRKALEQAACGCYRSDLERYAALFNATHCG